MTSAYREDRWVPTSEELAAYVDGEFEGTNALTAKKHHIEQWLADHPEAAEDLSAWRTLKHIWHETTPAPPTEAQWEPVLAGIRTGIDQHAHGEVPTHRVPWGWMFGAAAAVLLTSTVLLWQWVYRSTETPRNDSPQQIANHDKLPKAPTPGIVLPDEPFQIAEPHEIEILHVRGDDTDTLVVGTLPMQGTMPLAEPGEVIFDEMSEDIVTGMEPTVVESTVHPPLIWVRSGP